jgi:hypothetical protein
MFSKRITESGRFLKMPPSSQALYFQLGMNADDDGVVEAFKVMKLTNSNEDDLKVLVSKNFIKILNEDLVAFVMDWSEHNLIRADRKIDSIYKELLLQIVPEIEVLEAKPRADTKKLTGGQQMDVQCPHRLGKDRLGKDRLIGTPLFEEIFKFWNEQKIITHNVLTDKMKTKIKSALKDYSLGDIKIAITKYKQVLTGDQYFWSYKWTLPDFLSRGLTKFLDTPIDGFKQSNGFEKEKKKKVYYNGNPVVEKNGKKYVIIDGEWKEFCGEEKDLITKFE